MAQSAMPARKQTKDRGKSVVATAPHQSFHDPVPASGQDGMPEEVHPHEAAPPAGTVTFEGLSLPRQLIDELTKRGISDPFPIQAATIPDALSGRDVLGRGRTGSGKTLAFGLALLARLAGESARPRHPRALVLVPTRELAQQVQDALNPYGRALGLRLATVTGGASMSRQIDSLSAGVDVLVATPGRLTDLIERRECRLDNVGITVLDEADQMADMGFLPQVTVLLDQVASGGQRLLFSATLDGDVDALVRRYLVEPVTHSVDPASATISTMTHHLLSVSAEHKQQVINQIAARDGRTLLFVRTKHSADRMAKQLTRSGVRAAALHGGKTQAARTRTLRAFREGAVTSLVATDVAARGIHVSGIDLVVNIDPPGEGKDYLHRGGRTARAGESGAVVTLVQPDQRRGVRRMMTRAGIEAEQLRVAPGEEELARVTGAREPSGVPVPEPDALAAPRPRSRQGKSGRPQKQGQPREAGAHGRDRSGRTGSGKPAGSARSARAAASGGGRGGRGQHPGPKRAAPAKGRRAA